ncbi:hypothetical protein XOC_4683 [Xanthomonas oryzae pv. oryzicola BLS256]|uniref:Uncharacterized protein n=1 Tax=Xanthomonas oryzae pv. oryzicola (strain BLS256) TaxID=383407 RepID=G7TD17_XANOB|nr:hypothetical protein XOC_4683 [Xanthomonas oryzae pv. oryzicola BLS256]QEO99932.1 hypothetical protein XOCgx_4945 [Xanthomonas oryzae pv. oryzicola]
MDLEHERCWGRVNRWRQACGSRLASMLPTHDSARTTFRIPRR